MGIRLVNAPFAELLPNEYCDTDRFERVEHKIRAHQTTLKASDSGKPVDVVTGKRRKPSRRSG